MAYLAGHFMGAALERSGSLESGAQRAKMVVFGTSGDKHAGYFGNYLYFRLQQKSGELAKKMSEQTEKTDKKNLNRKKIGLALGGGGAKGLAHIGVIKALQQAEIPIDYIAGTSMGALVGGWYAAKKNILLLENLFLQIDHKSIFPVEKMVKTKDGSLFQNKTIVELLESGIGRTKIEDCQIPFAAVATNVANGDEVIIKEGKLSDAIRASIALPVIFSPVKINDKLLMDGGLINPVPADILKEMGAEIVIAVDVSSRWLTSYDIKGEPVNFKNFYSLVSDVFSVLEYQIAKKILKEADIILRPPVINYDWLDFHRAKGIIEAGSGETKRNLEEIRKKTGYLKKEPETLFEKFINFLLYNEE